MLIKYIPEVQLEQLIWSLLEDNEALYTSRPLQSLMHMFIEFVLCIITSKFASDVGEMSVLTMDGRLEELISSSLLQTEQGVQLVMDPGTASKMISNIAQKIEFALQAKTEIQSDNWFQA